MDPAGSARTISHVGLHTREKPAQDPSVPPLPTPHTTASTSWPVWSQISGPVLVSWANWVGRVGELIDVETTAFGISCRQPRGEVLVILRVAASHVRAGQAHLRAQRADVG